MTPARPWSGVRTVNLRSGGSITLTLTGNALRMDAGDRSRLCAMLDLCDGYERRCDGLDDLARWRDDHTGALNLAAAYRPDGVP